MQRLVYNMDGAVRADMVAGNCDFLIGEEEQTSYDQGTEVVFAVDGSVLVNARIEGVGAWLKDRAVFAVTQ
jgi:hypothetical protein